MDNNALSNAVAWFASVLTGTVATTVAVLAVASVGWLALTGRVAARRAARVVVGCFILFAAPIIAHALTGTDIDEGALATAASPRTMPSYTPTIPQATPYDPYAGASVPTGQDSLASKPTR